MELSKEVSKIKKRAEELGYELNTAHIKVLFEQSIKVDVSHFKKQSILLKKKAKEFGYEIKLTHVQEMLATALGFENRHVALKMVIGEASDEEVHYFCPDCNESWSSLFEEQYGYCDEECPKCGHTYTAFESKQEWQRAIKKHK